MDQQDGMELSKLMEVAQQPIMLRVLNTILLQAIRKGASVISFIPEKTRGAVYYLQGREFVEEMTIPMCAWLPIITNIKLLSGIGCEPNSEKRVGVLKHTIDGRVFKLPTAYMPSENRIDILISPDDEESSSSPVPAEPKPPVRTASAEEIPPQDNPSVDTGDKEQGLPISIFDL